MSTQCGAAECPFYKGEEGRSRIRCEGLGNCDTSTLINVLPPKECFEYKSLYCYSKRYNDCKIAQILYSKYEDHK